MRIFVSYAHVDEYRVRELVGILSDASYDPWFDHRLVVGRAWEDQILEAMQACDRFLYALTPESVESKWCRWEFAQAVHAGKPVVPVLLQANALLDGVLGRIQYADFSRGPTPRAVAKLLAGVREAQVIPPDWVPLLPVPHEEPERPIEQAPANPTLTGQLFADAYTAFRARQYVEAHDLLHDCLSLDPQHADARQLLGLVSTRAVRAVLPPPFAWVDIPAGRVTLTPDDHDKENSYLKRDTEYDIPAFAIAKYPVTNAQYAKFIQAGGYEQARWWTEAGWQARQKEGWTEPRHWGDEQFNGAEQPVVGVSWYEAVAFCCWLSEVTGGTITLPTEQQWQRAAQGDDGRDYPWGDEPPDERRCNFDRNVGQTTPVTRYPAGASPYGVMDMAGNVWEWCLTVYETDSVDLGGDARRVVRGGPGYNYQDDARAAARLRRDPFNRNYNFGFRVACSAPMF